MQLTLSRWLFRSGYLFVTVLLLGPFGFLTRAQDDPYRVPAELLLTVTAWAFAAAMVAAQALHGRAALSGGDAWLRRLGAALLAWMAVSAFFGVQPAAHLSYLTTAAAFLVGAQAFAGWLGESPARRIGYFMGVATVLVAAESALAVAQALKLPWLKADLGFSLLGGWVDAVGVAAQGPKPIGDAFGTFGNRNYLSELLTVLTPAIVGWAATFKRWPQRLPVYGVALASVGIIVFNGTRSALLGLIIGVVASVLIVFGRRLFTQDWKALLRRSLPTVAVLAVLAVGVGAVAGSRLAEKLGRGADDSSANSRLIHLNVASTTWLERPITGTGVGGYQLTNVRKLGEAYPTGLPEDVAAIRFYQLHNDPMQALIELGVVGLVGITAFAVLWLRRARSNPLLPATIRIGLVAGVVAVWVTSLFGFPFHVPHTAMAILLMMAVGVVAPPSPEAAEVGLAPSLRWPYALVAVALIAAVGWVGTSRGAWPTFLAGHYDFLATRAKRDMTTPAAETLYGLAAKQDRMKAVHLFRRLALLTKKRQYVAVIAEYDANQGQGLGMDALLLRGNALMRLGRKDEARTDLTHVMNYYSPNTRNYKIAKKRLDALASPAPKVVQ